MKGAVGGELVAELVVEGEEVYVVHDHVVTLVPAEEEANIEERGTIKPAEDEGMDTGSHTAKCKAIESMLLKHLVTSTTSWGSTK